MHLRPVGRNRTTHITHVLHICAIKRHPRCKATADLLHILSKLTIGVQTRILQQLTKYADTLFYPSQALVLLTRGFGDRYRTEGHQGEIRLLEHMRIFFYILLKPSILLNRLKGVTLSKLNELPRVSFPVIYAIFGHACCACM